MDGEGIPKSAERARRRGHRKKASPGLRVIERNGFWHIHGTLRVKGRTVRVRRSTDLPATDELLEEAEKIRDDKATEIRNEIIHGIKPSVAVAIAASRFLKLSRERPLGETSVKIIQEITLRFGKRTLSNIKDREWIDFVEERQAGNSPTTRERYIGTVASFLNWCRKKPNQWIEEVPAFHRDSEARNPRRRAKRRVEDLRPELIAFMIDHAEIHVGAQLAVEWSTGARVSSILHGCRLCDLILAGDRSQVTFHATKNGETVTAHLHPWAAEKVAEYLEVRGGLHDREGPVFKHPYPFSAKNRTWRAYSQNSRGSQNRTSFNTMKRRASRELIRMAWKARADGDRESVSRLLNDARLVRRFTQHWFRHLLATILLRDADLVTAMGQGGWKDPKSVLGYSLDVPEYRRSKVNQMPVGGTSLTHETKAGAKTS